MEKKRLIVLLVLGYLLIQLIVPVYSIVNDAYDVNPWASFSWGMYAMHPSCVTKYFTFEDGDLEEIDIDSYFTVAKVHKRTLLNTKRADRFAQELCEDYEKVYLYMSCLRMDYDHIEYENLRKLDHDHCNA